MIEWKTILFLCTGNYYRSRFAEILFNHHAERHGLGWRADSRGLATELGVGNAGAISRHTLRGLQARGIFLADEQRFPMQVTDEDLARADRVIAVKEAEHKPMMLDRFPNWADAIDYWHIHDLDDASADEALPLLERAVLELTDALRNEPPSRSCA